MDRPCAKGRYLGVLYRERGGQFMWQQIIQQMAACKELARPGY